jgi:hypothetical protein
MDGLGEGCKKSYNQQVGYIIKLALMNPNPEALDPNS